MSEISDDTIQELAESPAKLTTEEGTVQERNIQEVIAADRHLASKDEDSQTPPYGLRISRIRFPGTV